MKKIVVKEKEDACLKGRYTFTKAKLETTAQWALHSTIEKLQKDGEPYMDKVRELNRMCETEVLVFENIIPTVGRTMIANNLAVSAADDDPFINYTALGTDDTAVADGQTTLIAETYRKTTASGTNADNVAYVSAFYTAAEVDGTFYEAGLFCDATAAADDGILFSRVLLNAPTGLAKSVTETLTIDYTITIS